MQTFILYSKIAKTSFCNGLITVTCLTLQVCITRCALTQVAVDLINTGTAVLTGGTGTLVYVCRMNKDLLLKPLSFECDVYLTFFNSVQQMLYFSLYRWESKLNLHMYHEFIHSLTCKPTNVMPV